MRQASAKEAMPVVKDLQEEAAQVRQYLAVYIPYKLVFGKASQYLRPGHCSLLDSFYTEGREDNVGSAWDGGAKSE